VHRRPRLDHRPQLRRLRPAPERCYLPHRRSNA
jgi:hypothetical protein